MSMIQIKRNIGWIIIALGLIVPTYLWLNFIPLSARIVDLSSIFRALGQITAILGFALISFNVILSARIKLYEKLFWGMNKVYDAHNLIGSIGFSLILFHPTFLLLKYLPTDPQNLLPFLANPTKDLLAGAIAFALLVFALVITLYAKFAYQNWKLTHKLLAPMYLFAAYHVFVMASDVSVYQPLKIYFAILTTLAIIAAGYRVLLSTFLSQRYKYKVEQIEELNGGICKVTLSPVSKKLNYLPGQFIFVSFQDKTIGKEAHPFSAISSPDENNLVLGIKNLGDFTSQIKSIPKGTLVKIEGAYGKMYYQNYENKNQIWIAGGIGITPFVGMIKSLKNNFNYNINLYYSTQTPEEMCFLTEMQEIEKQNPNVKIHPYVSNEKGRLTAEYIRKDFSNLANEEILICGPKPMMKDLSNQFKMLSVLENQIHTEEFNFATT